MPDDVREQEPPSVFDDAARLKLLGEVSGFLATAGWSMRGTATRAADKPGLAIAVCVQIAAALGRGVVTLIRDDNYYATALQLRQTLEVTQLIQYLMAEPHRATFWLTSEDDLLKKAADFRPQALRKATGGSDQIYSQHCMFGGHPRAISQLILPGGAWYSHRQEIDLSSAGFAVKASLRSLMLCDALQHLVDAATATLEHAAASGMLFDAMGTLEERSYALTEDLVERIVSWRTCDQLATLGPIIPDGIEHETK